MYKGGGVVHCCVRDRDPNPGVGARHPPGAPPRDEGWGWGLKHTKPRGTGDFHLKSPENPGAGYLTTQNTPGPPGEVGDF